MLHILDNGPDLPSNHRFEVVEAYRYLGRIVVVRVIPHWEVDWELLQTEVSSYIIDAVTEKLFYQ